MNYKRFAASAALASAIAYPTWTGSWSAFPRSFDEFSRARTTQAENSYFAKSKTTRAEFMRRQNEICNSLSKSWKPWPQNENVLISLEDERALDLDACRHPAIVFSPDENLESYLAGFGAAIPTLAPLAADIVIGALVAGLFAFFGPRAVIRYYRWLQAE